MLADRSTSCQIFDCRTVIVDKSFVLHSVVNVLCFAESGNTCMARSTKTPMMIIATSCGAHDSMPHRPVVLPLYSYILIAIFYIFQYNDKAYHKSYIVDVILCHMYSLQCLQCHVDFEGFSQSHTSFISNFIFTQTVFNHEKKCFFSETQ